MKLEYVGGGRFVVTNDEYKAMNGTVTDLASIPRIFTSIFSVTGNSLEPAIIHDFHYSKRSCMRNRKEVDKFFYHNLIRAGEPVLRAKLMYWAVRLFGAKKWKT